MIEHLIQFALRQRLFMLLMVALLAAGGYLAFRDLPIDAFPDVSSPQVKIVIKAAGMTPEEVEARITAPVEVEMLGIPDQVMLRSMAKYGLTDITVDFAEGTDMYWARQQVAERLGGDLGRSARGHRRRHRPHDHAARGDVHVHRERRRSGPDGAPQPARLGHPPGAAHRARGGGRELARGFGAQLRGGARQPAHERPGREPDGPARDPGGQQPQRRGGAPGRGRGDPAGARRGQYPVGGRPARHRGGHLQRCSRAGGRRRGRADRRHHPCRRRDP